MSKATVYLGIDIGGTSVKYGWGGPLSGLKSFDRIQLKNGSVHELTCIIQKILDITINDVGLDSIKGIGLGSAGMIDKKSGKLFGVNPNLREWIDLNPADIFPVRYRSMIRSENDANLMALAEADKEPEAESVIGITIGTGIGCGFVQKGRIFRGSNGLAMELGHNVVKPGGEQCNCGRKGCLEAYASLGGLRNRIAVMYPEFKVLGFEDIITFAAREQRVKKFLLEAVSYLALVIANLAINLDPDLVVIGGGAVELDDYPFLDLVKKIKDILPEHLKPLVRIKKAFYGNTAGVMGGILLASQDNGQ